MKQQRQGVRSTKILESIPVEEQSAIGPDNSPTPLTPKKMKDVYIKIHMTNNTMEDSQLLQATEINTSWY
jgi:hypothetical protein